MINQSTFRGCCWLVAAMFTSGAYGAISGLELVVQGLNSPGFVTHAPGDNDRIFVAELGGDIEIIDLNTGTVIDTFLDITDADREGEGGLLGLAFHPDYANEGAAGFGKFYVNVTVDNPVPENEETFPFSTHIREYSVDPNNPNLADPKSVRELLIFEQPQSNHDGGWIGFGPNDGYLYIATGDGGGGFDNGTGHTPGTGNAQDLSDNLLGKILRIDVNVPDGETPPAYLVPDSNPFVGVDGDDEIWAYGLRNPFRNSFDRLTGDLWIGDVGQGQREEIDFQPADSEGGENYGWRYREGTVMTNGGVGGPDSDDYTDPVYDYERGDGEFQGETVIGGYVYRGPDPDLQGKYFFADADTGDLKVWLASPPGPFVANVNVDNINEELDGLAGVGRIVSFGEDNKGNLYIADLFGRVYRIATDNLIAGDYNADGEVDRADYDVWKMNYGATSGDGLAADGNGDDAVDAADYTVWRDNLGNSVHNLSGSGGFAVPEPTTAALATWALVLLLPGMPRRVRMSLSR